MRYGLLCVLALQLCGAGLLPAQEPPANDSTPPNAQGQTSPATPSNASGADKNGSDKTSAPVAPKPPDKKDQVLAPTGTVINLFATTNSVSLNVPVDIVATAIENGADVGTGSGATTKGAGTPVQTRTGPRPIEALRVGDLVLAQDTTTGALGFRPVLFTHHNPPSKTQAPLDFVSATRVSTSRMIGSSTSGGGGSPSGW